MTPLLSILICTLKPRKHLLASLMNCLEPQRCSEIEILVEPANEQSEFWEKDDRPTGVKRNILAERSTGEYLCHVDDDDLLAPDYGRRILAEVAHRPDVVSICGLMTVNGQAWTAKPFIHAIKYLKPIERETHFEQPPNHLDPVKREPALATPFKGISFAEDQDYAQRIHPRLKVERHIGARIYLYQHWRFKDANHLPLIPQPPERRR